MPSSSGGIVVWQHQFMTRVRCCADAQCAACLLSTLPSSIIAACGGNYKIHHMPAPNKPAVEPPELPQPGQLPEVKPGTEPSAPVIPAEEPEPLPDAPAATPPAEIPAPGA
jgi:hypothetical protein